MPICRSFLTGATGLEPATSGVTGRCGAIGYNRLRPGITGWSGHFRSERTGCDRLRPAATRQGLCGRCVAGVVSVLATVATLADAVARADEASRPAAHVCC
jgi:hypothetical protein